VTQDNEDTSLRRNVINYGRNKFYSAGLREEIRFKMWYPCNQMEPETILKRRKVQIIN